MTERATRATQSSGQKDKPADAGYFSPGKARDERRRECTQVHDRLKEERNAGWRKIDKSGAVAQLGEHLLCKQGVTGSIPVSSTIHRTGWHRKRPAWAVCDTSRSSAGPIFNNSESCWRLGSLRKQLRGERLLSQRVSVLGTPKCLGLYGQATKRIRWMPRRQKAKKDVVACDKLRGAGKQALIRRFPNGETHRFTRYRALNP